MLAVPRRQALKYFKVGKRKSEREEESFWSLSRAPQWVTDLAREVHAGMFPDDYKFEYMHNALEVISDRDDRELDDMPEMEADVYNYDRLKWLGSHLERSGYVDEATKDFGHAEGGIIDDIAMGQLKEMEEVYGIVLQHLRDRAEEIEE